MAAAWCAKCQAIQLVNYSERKNEPDNTITTTIICRTCNTLIQNYTENIGAVSRKFLQ